MKNRADYVAEITLLIMYPTFEDYYNPKDSEFNIRMGLYKDEAEARKASEDNYNWRIALAKTALANGWKLPSKN